MLGNVVHALGTYLYLHPLVFRSQHGGVQALIAIALRHGEPVAHTLRVRLIHVGDDGEHLPALLVFHLTRHIEDDTDGEEVIYALKTAVLLLHLLPDGVDALCSALHVVLQSSLV